MHFKNGKFYIYFTTIEKIMLNRRAKTGIGVILS